MNPEIQSQIFAFIIFLIPLIAALWKLFNLLKGIEDRLEVQIREVDQAIGQLSHQSQLRSTQLEALNDKLILAVNGNKELVNHLRARTKNDSDRLAARVNQIERFLVKTSDYQPRE
ncbi:MAG: hypothetical protein MUF72_10080 [Elainella sp. Prado103]|jgi:hypothetical protein|nr:hypothetical protein [Elainella sp. Prado103]